MKTKAIKLIITTIMIYVSVFLECAKIDFYTLLFKEPPKEIFNITIKENMKGELEKDETFQNAFSKTLVMIWSLGRIILS